MKIDEPQDCPLCTGTGFVRVEHNDDEHNFHFTKCDHTYLSYNGKVIFTGWSATIALMAILYAAIGAITLIALLVIK